MREIIALMVCILAASIIILLSVFAASRQREPVATSQQQNDHKRNASPSAASAELPDGKVVFEKQRCHTCHSFKGRGNTRSPLDAAANQLTPEELREWITGTGNAAPLLPATIKRRKANYQKLSDAEMSALTRYLSPPETSTNRSPILYSPY